MALSETPRILCLLVIPQGFPSLSPQGSGPTLVGMDRPEPALALAIIRHQTNKLCRASKGLLAHTHTLLAQSEEKLVHSQRALAAYRDPWTDWDLADADRDTDDESQ
jgi:hypothetical protein